MIVTTLVHWRKNVSRQLMSGIIQKGDFSLQTDEVESARRPDIVLIQRREREGLQACLVVSDGLMPLA